MQWYYSKNGTQLGPVAQGELIAKLASGEVSPNDLVWKDGMADWIPASRVPELAVGSQPPSAPVSSPVSSPVGSSNPSPYVAPSSPPSYVPNQEIPNYLWQSIVVTVLCCVPFGIPAIVFAAKVDGLKARGDYNGALDASKKAKLWSWIAFGCGLSFGLIYIIAMIAAGASGNLQ